MFLALQDAFEIRKNPLSQSLKEIMGFEMVTSNGKKVFYSSSYKR